MNRSFIQNPEMNRYKIEQYTKKSHYPLGQWLLPYIGWFFYSAEASSFAVEKSIAAKRL